MQQVEASYANIKGWGIDADPENDPTYPIKSRSPADHQGLTWQRPPQQPAGVEVLHSNERPGLSAVYGTSSPPSGLSGILRRRAFNSSESSYGHWLPLMLADRVNMVEGLVDDVLHGHLPNFCAELGWKAEWKYNRPRLLRKIGFGLLLVSALALARKRD